MPASSDCAALMRSRGARTRGTAADSSQLPAGRSLTCSLISSWSSSTWRRRRLARTPTWTWVLWSRPTIRGSGSFGGGSSWSSKMWGGGGAAVLRHGVGK